MLTCFRKTTLTTPAQILLAALAFAGAGIIPPLHAAPLPKAAERLSWYGDAQAPNLSGVWERVAPSKTSANPASKEGWLPWPPPLNPPYQAIWQQRVSDAEQDKRTDDPIRGCLPPGMPRFMSGTNNKLLIIQTPGRVILYRDSAPVRRVWLNASAMPTPENLESFSNGNAIGRYEGKELVTEVLGIKDQPIDSTGVPHSEELKIVERFKRINANTLQVTLTLTDPIAYSAPLSTTVTYRAVNDTQWRPQEFICSPVNNYHPDVYAK